MRPDPAHLFDYSLLGDWYSSQEVRRIFTEASTVRAWLEVEAALAESQAELDLIPEWAAEDIRRAVSEADISLEDLARETVETAHPLIGVLRELERRAGEAGRFVHWGATTQDVLDTAVILQLEQVYDIVTRDLEAITDRLTDLAETHRNTMMMGRTHGIHALPTTLGFKFAVWVGELLRDLGSNRVGVGCSSVNWVAAWARWRASAREPRSSAAT